MTVSYNGLWKKMIDKNLQKQDLVKELRLSSATVAKMGKGEPSMSGVILRMEQKIVILHKDSLSVLLYSPVLSTSFLLDLSIFAPLYLAFFLFPLSALSLWLQM